MKKYIITIAVALLALVSCSKTAFETEDSSRISGPSAREMVAEDPSFLLSYINGMYSYMVQYNTSNNSGVVHDDFGYLSVLHNLDLGCQDIAVGGTLNWGTFDIPHGYGSWEYRRTFQAWNFFYTLISKANEIIDFFGKEDPDNDMLKGFLGQCYAMRAFSYFNLIQIYQDPVSGEGAASATFDSSRPAVPIVYSVRDEKTAEETEAKLGRNTVADVMKEIEADFGRAEKLLEVYDRGSKNEIDYSVLKGIEARYYLLTQDWGKASAAAVEAQKGYTVLPMDKVIGNGFMEVNDPEVIWGFNHSTETQTSYASFFSHLSNECSGYGGVGQSIHCIDKALYDKIPDTDVRKDLFNGPEGDSQAATTGGKLPYASRKFGYMDSWLQDYLYMRVEEMILIEAECAARTGGDAASALGKLMTNRVAGWTPAGVTLEEVLFERRVELWGECFEFFDLRRNGLGIVRKYDGSNHAVANQFDFPAHHASWNYQIPMREIQENKHLTQEENNEYIDPTV